MRFKITISCLLILAVTMYSFTRSDNNSAKEPTSTDPNQNKFILGAMHNFSDSVYTYLSDTLGFNIWHKYTVPYSTNPNGWGWPIIGSNNTLPADQLDTPVYRYASDIRERIELNNSENLMTLLDRPKFEYLAFGQRSDYQCENASKVDPDYWFYTYYNNTDNGTSIKDIQDSTHGSGEYVKQCLFTQSNPGANAQMLFDSLKGNMEQINTHWPVTWLGDQHYDWYIMPRIRIDSAFANNPANQDIEVCKIIVKNRDGDSLTQIIKVKHFKPNFTGSIYHGNYLDTLYDEYPSDPITNLIIPAGDWFNDSAHISFGDKKCRIDFKVFWYDKCDMWIDRIRVEDKPAHEMMTLELPKIEEWIRAEVEDIVLAETGGGNQSPYKFYIEEFEMNHLPSIGYLNKKIIQYSGGRLSLMVNYNHDLVKAFIPNSWDKLFSAVQAKKYLIDSAKLREIFTICYNLEGWRNYEHDGGRESYVPNTLYNGPEYQILDGLLVYKKSPADYDTWVQEHFDDYRIKGLNLKHILEFSDSISYLADVPFNFMTQAHLWIGRGHMLKEPSNEEIALTTNLAISYGAKGIMYFSYGSSNPTYDTLYQGSYHEVARGLVNTDNSPRRLNVYGQNKWEGVKKINSKLNKWGPYLMSFDNISRESYIVRSEISDLTNETYFNDILSYQPDPYDFSIPVSFAEPIGQRYLQAAVFENPDEEYSKYFMVVNRRGSPVVASNPGGTNGRRSVTIKLDSGSATFPEFHNWGVYDLEKDTLIKSFDKRLISTIHLSWFLPGEGKLYKIAPVMQEGGTLVADESV